jgi:hypothetical protein
VRARAEQREYTVAGRLHDVAVVAMDRVDHQLEGRLDDRARFSGSSSVDPLIQTPGLGADRCAVDECRLAFAFRMKLALNRRLA